MRKGKYVNTDPDVAVERGNEALARDKKGIFRFNPGQQHKTFPDYNPYTIRRCRDCDIASGKATLARLTPSDNELCQACRFIRTCAELRSDIQDPEYGERLLISAHADQSELKPNLRAAKVLLSKFPDMKIRIREHIFEHGVKNPEYEINGLIADRKGIEGENGIASAFNKAKKQGCSAVVIDLDMRMSNKRIKWTQIASKIFNRKIDFQEGLIKECYVVYKDNVVVIDSTHGDREAIYSVLKKIKP